MKYNCSNSENRRKTYINPHAVDLETIITTYKFILSFEKPQNGLTFMNKLKLPKSKSCKITIVFKYHHENEIKNNTKPNQVTFRAAWPR